MDFQESLNQTDASKSASLDSRSETTYLNIIGAMLETLVSKDSENAQFSSESELKEFLSEKYEGFYGLSENNLGRKFAEAKKMIKSYLE
jgi:hypothetical protein